MSLLPNIIECYTKKNYFGFKNLGLTRSLKRRKIKIVVLKNEEGVWVDNPMQLKTLVHDYFQNLFAYTHTTSLEHWSNLTKHISPEDQRDMGRKSVQKALSIHLGKYKEKTCWVEIWDVILGRTNNPDTICH
ncbi:hypothetical protein ACSBR2_030878 [Camellia fascicularis]